MPTNMFRDFHVMKRIFLDKYGIMISPDSDIFFCLLNFCAIFVTSNGKLKECH